MLENYLWDLLVINLNNFFLTKFLHDNILKNFVFKIKKIFFRWQVCKLSRNKSFLRMFTTCLGENEIVSHPLKTP